MENLSGLLFQVYFHSGLLLLSEIVSLRFSFLIKKEKSTWQKKEAFCLILNASSPPCHNMIMILPSAKNAKFILLLAWKKSFFL